ncbi:MAG: type II toxin-antitoxin system VapC family toxin [Clostridia bacterium]|nr:type II toxin-antitoxin system VapC family toxin [Clostridia bacterium]
MMYMLDTNALIAAVRHPDWPIRDKIKSHLGIDLCISAITYGELEYGIRKSTRPNQNRVAVNQLLLGIRILDFDQNAASEFGDIIATLERQGQRICDRDMLIAAHARSRHYTLITHNTGEFARVIGLCIEDWQSLVQ